MSRRERFLLVLGLLGAIFVVAYPLAYRISTEWTAEAAPRAAAAQASARPAAAPTARPSRTPAPPPGDSWKAAASEHRGREGVTFTYACSPGGILYTVWGTDVYTDDSSVCTAGVHAGVISREDGGTVTILIRPGQDSYEGSVRNGVGTESYESWGGSFEIVPP